MSSSKKPLIGYDIGIALYVPHPTTTTNVPTHWSLIIDTKGENGGTYTTPSGTLFTCRQTPQMQGLRITRSVQMTHIHQQRPKPDTDGLIQKGVVHIRNIIVGSVDPCDRDEFLNSTIVKIVRSVPPQDDSKRWVYKVLKVLGKELVGCDLLKDYMGCYGDVFKTFESVEARVNKCYMEEIKGKGYFVSQIFG
ncbi:hypothetical protein CVT24_012225 [Panaeolus cyanescens]|uniref:Uncharacterized protein n=1 Tax=Panaeolus cyanescens TaxID=181874 RepID=A0A409VYQ1_9AGAR|nr:hypothetical protein CVT24_012225 [Panaeolus cyanescens]